MTHLLTRKSVLYGIVLALVLTIVYLLGVQTKEAHASAPSGLQSTIATSSLIQVGPGNAVTVIATTTCASRIITTSASSIMMTMSDYLAQSPTATFGIFQGASTTVAYDSGLYGCGLVKAYGFTASTSITINSTQ